MGYLLNSLGNLPVDDDVRFYLFVINGLALLIDARTRGPEVSDCPIPALHPIRGSVGP